MKAILTALLLIPCIAFGQETAVKKADRKLAISLKQGIAPDNSYYPMKQFAFGYIRSSLNGVLDLKHMQVGLTVEGGTNNSDYWYVAPAALINCKVPTGNSYFYVGSLLGYVYMQDMLGGSFYSRTNGYSGYMDGIITGMQVGYNQTINKHWAFTSEIGIRTMILVQGRYVQDDYIVSKQAIGVTMLPVSLGMQYRF